MASLHFTRILLLCHTLHGVIGQTASSSTTMSTPMSISSTNTSPAGGGQATSSILPSSTTNPVQSVAPQISTSTPSSTTPPPAQGQSNNSTSMTMSAVSMSPTSTFIIASSSSTSSPSDGVGAQVNITIYVNVSDCNGVSYEDLERNVKGNLTKFYKRDGVNNALTIILRTVQCTANFVEVVATITFKLEIGFNIVEDIEKGTSNNYLVDLSVDGSRVEVAFIGVKITFEIKEGECKRVCCDGAGGPVSMVSSCNPQDGNSNRCQGFKSEEKQEDGHCPGEANDLCSSTCDSSEGDRAGSVQCPSFVLLSILAVATFLK